MEVIDDKFSKELDVAVRVVHLACSLCQRVQERLLSTPADVVKSKDDNSPVTVADYGVQAIVCWILTQSFGNQGLSIVAEEDAQTLSEADSSALLEAVVDTVNERLSEAPRYGLPCPRTALDAVDVLKAIGRCSSSVGPAGRHWVLDPVDGTLGFVRGSQYAVALALIEQGKVVVGVLGCPNYPMKRELLNCHHQLTSHDELSSISVESGEKGCVMYAKQGTGKAWMQPLAPRQYKLDRMIPATPIRVSSIRDPLLATLCEPVEKTNTSHSFSQGVAHTVGLRNQPLRVYSMVKYAAIARGDAELYMKFAGAGYKEKIWDHAAGVLIVEEAGGMVTDAGGRPLDFSMGVYLQGLDRGVVASSGPALHKKIIGAIDASWESSKL